MRKYLLISLSVILVLVGALTGCAEDDPPFDETINFATGCLQVEGVDVEPLAYPMGSGTTYLSDNGTWTAPSSNFTLPYAMDFNGLNAYLSNATANFRSGDSAGKVIIKFRSSSGAFQTLFASSDTASSASYLAFCLSSGFLCTDERSGVGDTEHGVIGTTSVVDGKWHIAEFTSDGSTHSINLDGNTEILTVIDRNNGDWFADIPGRDNAVIGAMARATTSYYLTGVVAYVKIYDANNALVYSLPLTEGTGNPVDTVGGLTMTNNNGKWTELVAHNPSFTGNVTLKSYGAGTLVTDAYGRVSVSSDSNLKSQTGTLNSGLKQILNLKPIYYKWLPETGMDTYNNYLGFSAQDLKKYVPEAVGVNPDGTYSISDRAIIAYLIQSVKEMQDEIDALNARLGLKTYDRYVPPDNTDTKIIKPAPVISLDELMIK